MNGIAMTSLIYRCRICDTVFSRPFAWTWSSAAQCLSVRMHDASSKEVVHDCGNGYAGVAELIGAKQE